MTLPDAQTVASSATDSTPPLAATDQAVISDDFPGYRDARRAERSGKPLSPSIAAPAAAVPDVQAAETAASSDKPASEPGTASGHKGNADSRKAELQAEIALLLKQRAELRQAVPAVQPPPVAQTLPASQPAPKADGEPTLADFEADPAKYPDPYAAFVEARAEWRATQAVEKRLAERDRAQQDATAAGELKRKTGVLQSKIDAALAADPTLSDAILFDQFDAVPTSLLKPNEQATPQNDLAEAILDAEKPTDLMRYLSEQPKAFAALLSSPNPRAFWRELGRIEGQMAAPPAKPAPKTITDAPEPAPTVGTRHEAGSDVDSAVKSGDVAAYRAARLRERLAQLR
jgi:hypothetical protein